MLSKSLLELPGPGKYNDLDAFGKGAVASSIRGKRNDQRPNGIPGPGAYDEVGAHNTKDKSAAYKIGSGRR